jgi:hypothetical protein
MFMVAAADNTVWHYWLGVFLAIGAILGVLTIIALYIIKVPRQRYPKDRS